MASCMASQWGLLPTMACCSQSPLSRVCPLGGACWLGWLPVIYSHSMHHPIPTVCSAEMPVTMEITAVRPCIGIQFATLCAGLIMCRHHHSSQRFDYGMYSMGDHMIIICDLPCCTCLGQTAGIIVSICTRASHVHQLQPWGPSLFIVQPN